MRKPMADINITPLVDTLLVLVVLLMLAMPMYAQRLPVQLPKTGLTGAPLPVQTVQVTLAASGALTVNGQPARVEDLAGAVTARSTVVVAADAAVAFEQLAQLIVALERLGAREVVLAAR